MEYKAPTKVTNSPEFLKGILNLMGNSANNKFEEKIYYIKWGFVMSY